MDNASKNAKDMIDSLQPEMNHGCHWQAAITNKLVDIITGKFDSSPASPFIPVYPFNLFCVTTFVGLGF